MYRYIHMNIHIHIHIHMHMHMHIQIHIYINIYRYIYIYIHPQSIPFNLVKHPGTMVGKPHEYYGDHQFLGLATLRG